MIFVCFCLFVIVFEERFIQESGNRIMSQKYGTATWRRRRNNNNNSNNNNKAVKALTSVKQTKKPPGINSFQHLTSANKALVATAAWPRHMCASIVWSSFNRVCLGRKSGLGARTVHSWHHCYCGQPHSAVHCSMFEYTTEARFCQLICVAITIQE